MNQTNMSRQIREQMRNLRDLYKTLTSGDKPQEEALCACVFYVMRLMDEVLQMSTSNMEHEQQIFCRAMLIFVKQFTQQVEVARDLNSQGNPYVYVVEKRVRVEDIENAVEKVLISYRNVIDSLANMDRHMFLGIASGGNAYDLSPKLCATYSYLLNELAGIMGEQDNYAFLLNPTTRSIVRTESLLECREQHGKVIVINIPERMAEKSDILPIILIHEAYHVLGTLGLRKRRAQSYIQNMYNEVIECLFHDTDLFSEINNEKSPARNIREKLLEKWFSKGRDCLRQYLDQDENSRQFYGRYLAGKVRNCILTDLREMLSHLEENVMECYMEPFELIKGTDFASYQNQFLKASNDIQVFERNVHDLICEGVLDALEELFLFMYREVYADLACVAMIGINIRQYNEAFNWSQMSRMPQSGYMDTDRLLRQYLVTKVYGEFHGTFEDIKERTAGDAESEGQNVDEWEKESDRLYQKIIKFANAPLKGTVQMSPEDVEYKVPRFPLNTYITEPILKNFHTYFQDAMTLFCGRVKDTDGIKTFCEEVMNLIKLSHDDVLRERFLLNGFDALKTVDNKEPK